MDVTLKYEPSAKRFYGGRLVGRVGDGPYMSAAVFDGEPDKLDERIKFTADAMRRDAAKVLGIDVDQVNVTIDRSGGF